MPSSMVELDSDRLRFPYLRDPARLKVVVKKVKSPPPPLQERYEEVRHGHIEQG